jgi:peptidoglycan lytic transglycosylase
VESSLAARTWAPWRHAAAAVAVLSALTIAPGTASAAPRDAPLCDWLSGIGDAAQALASGRAAASEAAARRAFAARSRGAAGARASAALGLAAAARGDPAEAEAALEVALAPPTAPARSHLAYARGEALLSAGDASAAARLFDVAAAGRDLAIGGRARLREGQALLAAGLATEAVPLLEALLRESPGPAIASPARLALAKARRAVEDDAGAVEAYRALWLEADLPDAALAGEALAAWRAAGGPVPSPTTTDELTRADRLLAAGRPEAALDAIAAASEAEDPAPVPGRLESFRASALLAIGRADEAERLAAPLADAEDPRIQRTARWVLARAAARADRLDEASRRYAEVAALSAPVVGLPEWRQRDLADEAGFLAAWLYYDAGDYRRATPALDAFARTHPRSHRAADALWFAAWSRYRLGHRADAAKAFARLDRGPLGDAAAYWRGRLERNPTRQEVLYRTALARGGDGWYGLLARARLASLGAPAERAVRPPVRPLPESADPAASERLSVAVELLELGLEDEALAELRELSRSAPIRAAAALVAQLAAFTGDAELPFRMARDHLAPTRRTLRWGHPEALPSVLPERARAFGLEPTLLLAVMRRESSFRREARSGAGAEGLLQLRPVTAERLAALLGVPPGVGTRLAEPDVSVAAGAHYLALLAERFQEPAIALAAYNAGPRAAAEWARARAGMPLDAWVESIPYKETRQYVKAVLADWDVYRGLAGGPAAPIDPLRPIVAPKAGVAF